MWIGLHAPACPASFALADASACTCKTTSTTIPPGVTLRSRSARRPSESLVAGSKSADGVCAESCLMGGDSTSTIGQIVCHAGLKMVYQPAAYTMATGTQNVLV